MNIVTVDGRQGRIGMTKLALLGLGGMLMVGPATATAQSLGPFTWQLQPYCNRVTVAVTQNGGIYTLDGTDDQCGAAEVAPLAGVAAVNPDGSISFGLSIVSPSGQPIPVHARIVLPSLSGTWSDNAGSGGTFAPGANTLGLPPRPVAPSGDVTAVSAGAGLAGGGTSGDVSLTVNTAVIQSRVTTVCPPSTALRSIAQDGTASCEPVGGAGDITGVLPGAGLVGGGTAGDVTLSVAFAGSGSAATAARSDHTHGNVQFQALGHTAQAVPDVNPTAVTSWTSVLYNDGGGTYTPATGQYTVPVSGLYSVSATIYWTSFTTTLGYGVAIIRNSSEQVVNTFGGSNSAQSANGTVQHVSSVYKLTAGDTVRVSVFQGSGAARSLASTPSSSNFAVTLIR